MSIVLTRGHASKLNTCIEAVNVSLPPALSTVLNVLRWPKIRWSVKMQTNKGRRTVNASRTECYCVPWITLIFRVPYLRRHSNANECTSSLRNRPTAMCLRVSLYLTTVELKTFINRAKSQAKRYNNSTEQRYNMIACSRSEPRLNGATMEQSHNGTEPQWNRATVEQRLTAWPYKLHSA